MILALIFLIDPEILSEKNSGVFPLFMTLRYFNYTIEPDHAYRFIINIIHRTEKNQSQSQQEDGTLNRWCEIELNEDTREMKAGAVRRQETRHGRPGTHHSHWAWGGGGGRDPPLSLGLWETLGGTRITAAGDTALLGLPGGAVPGGTQP